MPLFIVLLAVPILKERLDMPRLAAVLVGLAGALLIVRPGSASFTPYALLPVAMAVVNALYQILTRKIAGIEPPMTSLFYGALVGAVMFTPAVPFAFVMPASAFDWVLFALLGVFATAGHLALIRAYEYAPVGVLAPFHYSVLVWMMLLGYLVFGDFPDRWSLSGIAIIVMSGLYIANRQRYVVHKQD
jgi:drug/metabolite transporter (DMT)-like permease